MKRWGGGVTEVVLHHASYLFAIIRMEPIHFLSTSHYSQSRSLVRILDSQWAGGGQQCTPDRSPVQLRTLQSPVRPQVCVNSIYEMTLKS